MKNINKILFFLMFVLYSFNVLAIVIIPTGAIYRANLEREKREQIYILNKKKEKVEEQLCKFERHLIQYKEDVENLELNLQKENITEEQKNNLSIQIESLKYDMELFEEKLTKLKEELKEIEKQINYWRSR